MSSVKDRSLQDIFPILNKVIPTDIHMSSPSTMQGKTEKKNTFRQKGLIISEHWSFQMYLESSLAKTNVNIDMRLMCMLTQEREIKNCG